MYSTGEVHPTKEIATYLSVLTRLLPPKEGIQSARALSIRIASSLQLPKKALLRQPLAGANRRHTDCLFWKVTAKEVGMRRQRYF
jgi:hypothetical protein